MRVLLVEDNDINLLIAADILEELGVTVDTATDGQQAVERFAASPEGQYHLIFMDLRMPVMDGLAAARAIRGLPRSDANVPIVAMTADAFAEDVEPGGRDERSSGKASGSRQAKGRALSISP